MIFTEESKREKWIRRFLKKAVHYNKVNILRNGTEAFPVMLKSIEDANETINLEFYKIQNDKTGWEFARALAKKQEEGCSVRVIYDSMGCIDAGNELFDYLKLNGVRTLEYHPVLPFSSKHWGWWKRNHRKMLIVDGKIAFVGGINLTDEYSGVIGEAQGWRDTDIVIIGPAVRDLQKLFLSTWNTEGTEPSDGKRFFPVIEPAGEIPVRILGSRRRKNRRIIRRAYLNAINNSRNIIFIANAYFVPDRGILRALKNAKKRGVDIRLILPAKTDIPPVRYASCALYSRFLRWGVRIFEWQGSVLHAKTAVIDGIWSTVGSFNIDRRSITHNLEVNVTIFNEAFGKKMTEMFNEDFKNCKEIELKKWKRRSLSQKFFEKLFYLIRHWF